MDLDRAIKLGGGVKGAIRWLCVYLVLHLSATAYGFWIDHQQDLDAEAQRVVNCERRNESVESSVLIVVEALIRVFPEIEPRAAAMRQTAARKLVDTQVDCSDL